MPIYGALVCSPNLAIREAPKASAPLQIKKRTHMVLPPHQNDDFEPPLKCETGTPPPPNEKGIFPPVKSVTFSFNLETLRRVEVLRFE